jgi:exonuclease III
MAFTIATWNINSVRLRAELVGQLLKNEAPEVLCLQECKSPVDKIPLDVFAALGYGHMVANGLKCLCRRPVRKILPTLVMRVMWRRPCLMES